MTRALLLALALLASPAMAQTASCQGSLDTCGLVVPCAVERVIDGDTLRVSCAPWPGLTIAVTARLRAEGGGMDAPELHATCASAEDQEAVRAAARRSREALAALAGERVLLHDVAPDKWRGRVLARVLSPDGRDLGAEMLAAGHARPYDDGRREPWCPLSISP